MVIWNALMFLGSGELTLTSRVRDHVLTVRACVVAALRQTSSLAHTPAGAPSPHCRYQTMFCILLVVSLTILFVGYVINQ